MITKLIDNTSLEMQEKYRILFENAFKDLKAANRLNEDEIKKGNFTDLSEYFAHAQDFLMVLNKPKYLLLPLDENHFTIKANTRKIEVPSEFKSCSGVVSDNLAEIIMFKIDRYFDFMDLASLNIDVQWQVRSKNGVKSGVSEIDSQFIDLDTFNPESQIRFGWPILNDMTLEGEATIEFSVRFYKKDMQTGVCSYVFNTLPETIPIRAGLNINKTQEGVEVITDHVSLFSNVVSNFNGPASGMPTGVSFAITNLDKDKSYALIDDTLNLDVCAYTSDQHDLTYQWYKEVDPSTTMDGSDRVEITNEDKRFSIPEDLVYLEVALTEEEKASRPFKKYFKKIAENTYESYDVTEAWPPEQALYQPHSRLTIVKAEELPEGTDESIAGAYFAVAINQKDGTDNKTYGESNRAHFYTPAKIKYSNQLDNFKFIEEEYDSQGHFVKYKPITFEMDINSDEHNPAITHTWQYRDTVDGSKTSTMPTGAEVKIQSPKEKTKLITSVPGYYSVEATSRLNRAEETANGGECFVSYLPAAPSIEDCKYCIIDGMADSEAKNFVPSTSDLKTWITEGSDPVSDNVTNSQWIYLQVDIDEFERFTSDGNVTYEWQVNLPNSSTPKTITATDSGEFGLIPTGYPVNTNKLIVKWNWQNASTAEAAASFQCKITNTISTESRSTTTQTVVFS